MRDFLQKLIRQMGLGSTPPVFIQCQRRFIDVNLRVLLNLGTPSVSILGSESSEKCQHSKKRDEDISQTAPH
jgi:hypothetical protein